MNSAVDETVTDKTQSRSNFTLAVIVVCGTLLFSLFVALGCWQIQRLSWKLQLIARVEQRVHAVAVAAPTRLHWSEMTAASDEYRHVRVQGVFLDAYTTKVLASTVIGRGFWVMTPMRTDDGSVVFINRGFIPFNATPAASPANAVVTGLLRITEPGGAFLHHNNPAGQLWYSRDVQAMAVARHLTDVAPYLIDADAAQAVVESTSGSAAEGAAETAAETVAAKQASGVPVGGLTVINFNNNHLVYTLTWFALALMVAGGGFYLVRSELKVRRRYRS